MKRQPSDEELAAIAATAVRQSNGSFRVLSSDGAKAYVVTAVSCQCKDFVERGGSYGGHCRHQLAVEFICPVPTPRPYVGDPFAGFA